MPTQIEAPTDAREMHSKIFSSETTQLPPALAFFLSMVLKNNVSGNTQSGLINKEEITLVDSKGIKDVFS